MADEPRTAEVILTFRVGWKDDRVTDADSIAEAFRDSIQSKLEPEEVEVSDDDGEPIDVEIDPDVWGSYEARLIPNV